MQFTWLYGQYIRAPKQWTSICRMPPGGKLQYRSETPIPHNEILCLGSNLQCKHKLIFTCVAVSNTICIILIWHVKTGTFFKYKLRYTHRKSLVPAAPQCWTVLFKAQRRHSTILLRCVLGNITDMWDICHVHNGSYLNPVRQNPILFPTLMWENTPM